MYSMRRFNWLEGSGSSASGFLLLVQVHCGSLKGVLFAQDPLSLVWGRVAWCRVSEPICWGPSNSRSLKFTAVLELTLGFNKALRYSKLSNGPQDPTPFYHLTSSLSLLPHADLMAIAHTSQVHSALPIFSAVCSHLKESPRSHSLPSIRDLS